MSKIYKAIAIVITLLIVLGVGMATKAFVPGVEGMVFRMFIGVISGILITGWILDE